ncbi:hypothetical protein A1O3_09898 [Capronia epimyces CBS 606.96]|uniref:Uncharacterized protein n=1 Tax=Capronia epimyces CBS 606.96 TaxID=1182542 RepID=W9Y5D2_9EURO|nr:uncharacterized protein A1O3_09898 [Capronia epimyces CBS 606.96]EXJ77669.1 hypothetical protein A1O3_09898 [Capronia epimyces CBS 606.96]
MESDPVAASASNSASTTTPSNPASTTTPSSLSDHPFLQPALHLQIGIGPAIAIGSLSRGNPLTVVPLTTGTLASEPDFPVRLVARLQGQGTDYVHNDPDGGRMRLKSDLVFVDLHGESIHVHYTGIVDITTEVRRILGRSANARSTDFVIQVSFETGSMRYKSLEQALFVGAGRFVIKDGALSVEYRISKVCKGEASAQEEDAPS